MQRDPLILDAPKRQLVTDVAALLPSANFQTGAPRSRTRPRRIETSRVNWNAIDWSKKDREIAVAVGCARTTVLKYRKSPERWCFPDNAHLRQPEEFKLIPLNRGAFAVVDNEDYAEVSKYIWSLSGRYVARRDPETKKAILLHNEISGTKLVDHKDGNGLNNRRSNLRPATTQQNAWNQKKRNVQTTSKYKGVYLQNGTGRWVAQIKVSGKGIYLGAFQNEIDAAHCYDAAAQRHFGEFARPNFPKPL